MSPPLRVTGPKPFAISALNLSLSVMVVCVVVTFVPFTIVDSVFVVTLPRGSSTTSKR